MPKFTKITSTYAAPVISRRKKKPDVIKNWHYYLMLIPAVAITFIFAYMSWPGILMAFQKYNNTAGYVGGEWVWFQNFKSFFEGPFFFNLLRNTFVINISNLVFGSIASIGFALLINEVISSKNKKIFQNILFLPTFFSVLLVSRFLSLILDNEKGLLNVLIENLGFSPIAFYDTPDIWVGIIVFAYIWKGVGYNLIVYLAAITGFDKDIYEAAEIDGAGKIKQIFSITLPMLIPTIIILVLLSIGKIFFGDFQLIYAIVGTTNTILYERLDIIETYLFRMLHDTSPDYGILGAVGVIQTALGFVFIFGSNSLIKLYNKDYSLF